MTTEQRERYSQRLFSALHLAVSRETPEGLGHDEQAWEAVEGPSLALSEGAKRFLAGEIDKDELDRLAVLLSQEWRGQTRRSLASAPTSSTSSGGLTARQR
jgi:hypothetical protein